MARSMADYHAALKTNQQPEMVHRDDYIAHMTFQGNAGPMFTELFGPIIGLKEEWKAQGATPQELDLSAFRYRAPRFFQVPVYAGLLDPFKEEILEEGPDYVIGRDRYGRRTKLATLASTLPLPMEHPVATMEDWLKFKHRYAFSEERFSEGWEAQSLQAREEGCVVRTAIKGGFDEPRQLLGDEGVCIACYEQPELIHDMLDTFADLACKMIDRITQHVRLDMITVHEDMAGKSGPMWGPAQVNQFMKPYYRRIWDLASSRGTKLFGQDSDANINPIIPSFIDAGLNVLWPMEPAAGMDIVESRRKFAARVAFHGGIDKHVLRRTKKEILAELEYKIPPMMESGGCMLGLDHRIPNGTPIENYRFYISKAWEIMGSCNR